MVFSGWSVARDVSDALVGRLLPLEAVEDNKKEAQGHPGGITGCSPRLSRSHETL